MTRLSKLSRSLHGRVAIVTGAGSGMGRATAHLLGDEGAKVAVVDVNRDGVDRVAGDGEQPGAEVVQRVQVAIVLAHRPAPVREHALVGLRRFPIAREQTVQRPAILAGGHKFGACLIPLCLPMHHGPAALLPRGCLRFKMRLPLQQLFDGQSAAGFLSAALFLEQLFLRQTCARLFCLEKLLRDVG